MKPLFTLLVCIGISLSLSAQQNLIVNGDFETGVKNAEWAGFNWDVDTINPQSGSYCARTQTSYQGDAGINYNLLLTFPDTNLYHFGAHIRALNPAKVSNIRIQYKTPNTSGWNILFTRPLNDTLWSLVDTVFTFPDSVTEARINMYQPNNGNFYLDSVFLMIADTTTMDTTTVDSSGNLIINGDFETGVKNAEWLGFNWDIQSEDVYEGSYAAATNSNYIGDAGINYVVPEISDTSTYHFGAYVKAKQADKAFPLRLWARDSSGNWEYFWERIVSDTVWYYVDTVFTLPGNGNELRINMFQPQGGIFLMDSVFLMVASAEDTTSNDSSTTYLASLLELPVLVYPNPAQDRLVIAYEANQPAVAQLMDMSGRLMLSQRLKTTREELYVRDLPRGLYLINIRLEDGSKIWRQKLLLD